MFRWFGCVGWQRIEWGSTAMLSGIAELCSPGGEASGAFEVLQNFSDPGRNCSEAWYIV
jgi:hypothetical protein